MRLGGKIDVVNDLDDREVSGCVMGKCSCGLRVVVIEREEGRLAACLSTRRSGLA